MAQQPIDDPWTPGPSLSGLMLSNAILVALMGRGVLTAEAAHGLLDESMAALEDWRDRKHFSENDTSHICVALRDLAYLRRMLRMNPYTRLPE
jgi:hypothetical protein